jgi:exonuclease III
MFRLWLVALVLPLAAFPATAADSIKIASFNVKWIGYYPERDDEFLAELMSQFDIVVVQELVAPPYPAKYPNGKKVKPDAQSAEFFDAMKEQGFKPILSPEDTGPGDKNHKNNASTEWFVAFYRDDKVELAEDLFSGFIAKDLTANKDYQRVPYAFAFRVPDGPDFVLISVHLQPNASSAARKRRAHELASIAKWIDKNDNAEEKDFIVLGDTNIQSCNELEKIMPTGFTALNSECKDTVTALVSRPYDQIFYLSEPTGKEIDKEHGFGVIDLVKEAKDQWTSDDPFPGHPYKSKIFPKHYSDHDPIHFQIKVEDDDD